MDEVTTGLAKVATGLAAVAIFLGLLLIIFFIGARAKGRLQFPAAMIVFLGPAILLLAYGLIAPGLPHHRWAASRTRTARSSSGFANYGWIFTTPDNRTFLINTVAWIIIAPLLSTGIGLMLALLLDRMRREAISKSLIFMPMAISFVGAGIIWGLVYEYRDPAGPQIGLLSQVAIWLGRRRSAELAADWQPLNSFLLMVIMIWIQVGFAMVVLSAAIKAIPGDVIEAAELDGATGWRLFSRVTIPMIRGTLIVVLTTIIIAVLKVFDIVRIMTNGNFGTQVVANEMYAQAFVAFDVGRGSALAVVLFVAVIPLIAYNVIQLRKERTIR